MRSAVLCAVPADGHVRPVLAVARGLMETGWHVRLLTGAAYRDEVTAAGATFVPLPDVPPGAPLAGLKDLDRAIREFVVEPAAVQAEALTAALDDQRADLVLADNLFLGAAVAEPRGVPYAVLGVMPLALPSAGTAPFGLGLTPWPGPLGRARNRLLDRLAARILLRGAHADLDRLLRRLGAPGLDGQLFTSVLRRPGLLAQCTVASFEYPRADAPGNLLFIGPPEHARPSADPEPLPFTGDRPIVHVTQGTFANTDWSELVAPTLDALAGEPVDVLVSTGGRPLSTLPPLPANAAAAEHLRYGDVLPHCAAFVTNGGYGGLHAAMEHGLPIVVAGETEEKRETAARVRWSGVGVDLRTGRPRPERVRAAVRAVLADPRYRDRSRAIGADISAAPGVPGLVARLNQSSV
ncbi:glycosyltransferase [Actinoplanes sp. CA-054009]